MKSGYGATSRLYWKLMVHEDESAVSESQEHMYEDECP